MTFGPWYKIIILASVGSVRMLRVLFGCFDFSYH